MENVLNIKYEKFVYGVFKKKNEILRMFQSKKMIIRSKNVLQSVTGSNKMVLLNDFAWCSTLNMEKNWKVWCVGISK